MLVAAKHQEVSEEGRAPRLFLRAKSNIGPDDGGFEYDIVQAPLEDYPNIQASVVMWGKSVQGSARDLLATAEESDTPLQTRLARVSQMLLYICGGVVILVALSGLLRGWAVIDVFMIAVSLAVAAVPEGLPAVVTIALAVGVQRMAARHVLVRKLPAVETLGNATVICTD